MAQAIEAAIESANNNDHLADIISETYLEKVFIETRLSPFSRQQKYELLYSLTAPRKTESSSSG